MLKQAVLRSVRRAKEEHLTHEPIGGALLHQWRSLINC
jgi:hypothetical protein